MTNIKPKSVVLKKDPNIWVKKENFFYSESINYIIKSPLGRSHQFKPELESGHNEFHGIRKPVWYES